MTKSTITRERLQEIAEDGFLKHGESKELARMALASVPDAYVRDERGAMMLNGKCEPRIGFGGGWNACRAAMLQSGTLTSEDIPYDGYEIKMITHPHFGPEPVKVFAIKVNIDA